MARDIRVLVWGLGEMGSAIVRELSARRGVAVVGAVCSRPEKVGRDVGELAGTAGPLEVEAMDNGNFATQLAEPDVVVVAHGATVDEDFQAIETALAYRADVVSIAEEMAYPWLHQPDLAARIEELARSAGKTVLGTGARPGLLSDTHILALTGGCSNVRRIEVTSVGDLAPFGPRMLDRFGVGMEPAVFDDDAGAPERPRGHIGFAESASMVADALGVKLVGFKEELEPVVASAERRTERVTVEAGRVAGLRQRFWALTREGVFMEFDQTMEVAPGAEGRDTFDDLLISADPPVALSMRPAVAADRATVGMACNMVPLAMKAPAGLLAMPDLPVPRGVGHDMRLIFRRSAARGRLVPSAPAGAGSEEAPEEAGEAGPMDDDGDE